VDILPVKLIPSSRRPFWKISNEYISGMGYPIHFYEIESRFVGIWERIMPEE